MSKVRIGARAALMLSAATILSIAAPAMAQSTEATPKDDSASADEIIVTAGRRTERLQDTSLTVTAVSAERLTASGVTDTAALQTSVPSLQVASSAGNSFVYLRGVGSNVFGTFSDNSVASYVDGVYQPRPTAALQELFDVKAVEVLRGPQATLYGRNATGGAILVTTQTASEEFQASGDVRLGNYNDQRYRFVLAAPLAGEKLGARISVVRHLHDGYSTNLSDGSRYDSQDYWGVRGTLSAKPTDTLSLILTGTWTKENGIPPSSKSINGTSLPFRAPNSKPFSADPRASYHNLANSNPLENYGVNLRVKWDTGIGELASTSAYNRYQTGPGFIDIDDSSAALLEYRGQVSDTKFYYQDLMLSSKSAGPVEWMIGGTYSRENTATFLPTITPGGSSSTDATTHVDSFAAYAQLGYRVTEKLKLIAGARYSDETRDARAVRTSGTTVGAPTLNNRHWTDFSPKFTVEFRPVRDVMIYASATKGFKSGAFDPINPATVAEPETIWNYEAGLRSQLFDRKLTFNVTAFHYDYKNLQVFSGVINGPAVTSILQNACCAKVNGLEIEPTINLSDNIHFGGSLTLLDAKYGNGLLADVANAVPGRPGVAATVPILNINGRRMMQAPKATVSVFGSVKVPLGDAGSLEFYADYFHQSSRFFSSFEDPTLQAPAYGTANARVTYNLPNEKFYIAGYVRNIGNTLVVSQMQRTPPFGTLQSYQAPRLYGFEMGFRF